MDARATVNSWTKMAPLTQEPFLGEKENVDPNGNFSVPCFHISNYFACPKFDIAQNFNSNSREIHLVLDLDHTYTATYH